MAHKAERVIEEMLTGINQDIRLARVLPAVAFAAVYPACLKMSGYKNSYADLAYYLVLFLLCMANSKPIREFLRLPPDKVRIPVFAGWRIDLFFTYPLMLAALISVLNSLLVMVGLIPRDVQNLSSVSFSLRQAALLCMGLPVTAIVEELFNLLLVVFIYKILRLYNKLGLVVSILAAALAFGLLHAFSWNLSAVFAIGISFIPVFIATLYLRSIWVSVLAHLYNDLVTMTGLYSHSFSKAVIVLILLPCAVGIIKELVTRKGKSSGF